MCLAEMITSGKIKFAFHSEFISDVVIIRLDPRIKYGASSKSCFFYGLRNQACPLDSPIESGNDRGSGNNENKKLKTFQDL
jgi:hypothetical protein